MPRSANGVVDADLGRLVAPDTLTLACHGTGDEAVLAGCVDGSRVLTARTPTSLSEINAGRPHRVVETS